MRIFFSVGEPSGDLHGANLIRALRERRPDVECVGYGGPLMAEAGAKLHFDLTALAVMWILRVVLNIHKFLGLLARADRSFRDERPDAVVLIDYPGFNWWIARRAKARGIPVFYYTPPQIWGWARWRVKKMKAFVDHVLCSLPFEEKWFRDHGCNATFIGHPYFDEVRRQKLDQRFVDWHAAGATGPLVTLLPGSRTQEVELNLPTFLRAAQEIRARVPRARFAVAAFREHQAEWARELIASMGLDTPVYVGRTPELIQQATCCIACSGSVSLELLHHRKPTVIGYRVSKFGNFMQDRFRQVPYITLVNLLATGRLERDRAAEARGESPLADPRVLFPEFLTPEDRSAEIGAEITRWLTDDKARERVVAGLDRLYAQVGDGGASARGADYIFATLAPTKTGDSAAGTPIGAPHYLHPAATKGTIPERSRTERAR
jgi:lipid-A-disaccharide synthase